MAKKNKQYLSLRSSFFPDDDEDNIRSSPNFYTFEKNQRPRNKWLLGLTILLFLAAAAAIITSGCFCFGASNGLLLPLCHGFVACCGALGVSASGVGLPTFMVAIITASISLTIFMTEVFKPGVLRNLALSVIGFVKNLHSSHETTVSTDLNTFQKAPQIEKERKSSILLIARPDLPAIKNAEQTPTDSGKLTTEPQPITPTPTTSSQAQLIASQTDIFTKPLTSTCDSRDDEFETMDQARKKLEDEIQNTIMFRYSTNSFVHSSWVRFTDNISNRETAPEDVSGFYERFKTEVEKYPDLKQRMQQYLSYAENKDYNVYLKNNWRDEHQEMSTRRGTMTNQYAKKDGHDKQMDKFSI